MNRKYPDTSIAILSAEEAKTLSADCAMPVFSIGTVLFSSRAPIVLLGIADIELCTNQGFKSVVPKDEIGTYFVYFYLLRERDKIANTQQGSTFAEISGKELAAYSMILPPISLIKEFNKKVCTICNYRKSIERELHHLRSLLSLLTSKLA